MSRGELFFFFFSSRRRHTRWTGDWSSDVCSCDLPIPTRQESYPRKPAPKNSSSLAEWLGQFRFGVCLPTAIPRACPASATLSSKTATALRRPRSPDKPKHLREIRKQLQQISLVHRLFVGCVSPPLHR